MNVNQKLAELKLKAAKNPVVADTSKRVQEQYKTVQSALKKVRISSMIFSVYKKRKKLVVCRSTFSSG